MITEKVNGPNYEIYLSNGQKVVPNATKLRMVFEKSTQRLVRIELLRGDEQVGEFYADEVAGWLAVE